MLELKSQDAHQLIWWEWRFHEPPTEEWLDNQCSNLWEFVCDENRAMEGQLSALNELMEKLHCVLGVHW